VIIISLVLMILPAETIIMTEKERSKMSAENLPHHDCLGICRCKPSLSESFSQQLLNKLRNIKYCTTTHEIKRIIMAFG